MGLLGAMVVGGAVGRRSARRQMESMQASQAQQQAIQQSQAQAAQAQAQAPSQGKKDPYQELEKLGNLKKQGLLSEEEFQKMKTQILSGM
jgi:type II secretory pathway pseudopilin PulG